MKSPLEIWAHQIRKEMNKAGEPVTPYSLAARMIIEDSRELQIFFFGGIRPLDHKRAKELADRVEVINYVAKTVTMN